MQFKGSTKVTKDRKITLVKEIADMLDVNEGDHILFYDDNGKVVLKKG